MESLLDMLESLLGWLVASGVGDWLLHFIMAIAVLIAMIFAAYVVSEKLTLGAANGALWTCMEIMFFFAPAAAVWNGGWWWAAPLVAAVLHGVLLRINEGAAGVGVTGHLKAYLSDRRSQ